MAGRAIHANFGAKGAIMRRIVVGTLTLIATLTFALPAGAVPAPAATVTPSTELHDGSKVRIKWKGYTPATVYLYECVAELQWHTNMAQIHDCLPLGTPAGRKGNVRVHVYAGPLGMADKSCGTGVDDSTCYIAVASFKRGPTGSLVDRVVNVPVTFVVPE